MLLSLFLMLSPLAHAIPLHPPPLSYVAACVGTDVRPELLRAIAMVESGERDTAVGDDGISIGRFQLNERFHSLRARSYGEYDPRDPYQAAYVAARILQDDYTALGSWRLAIAAYRQGIGGVRSHGAIMWYVNRVCVKISCNLP